MSNLENFKQFVQTKPSLIKYVKNDEMTWQKFYELYNLYGGENDIWKQYDSPIETKSENRSAEAATKTIGFADVVGYLKNIDLDSLGENINNIQRVIGVVQELGSSKDETSKTTYKPRPIYKHFED